MLSVAGAPLEADALPLLVETGDEGNPLLQDTFNTNRWDYLYSLQPGGGTRQQERMSIFFNDSDQLVSLSGDFMPGVSRDQEILGEGSDTSVQQPQTEVRDEPAKPGSLLEQIQDEVDAAEREVRPRTRAALGDEAHARVCTDGQDAPEVSDMRPRNSWRLVHKRAEMHLVHKGTAKVDEGKIDNAHVPFTGAARHDRDALIGAALGRMHVCKPRRDTLRRRPRIDMPHV